MEPTKELVDQLVTWVRFLFDQVVGSMDWGSGFLDTEEAVQVLAIAEFLGVTQSPAGFSPDRSKLPQRVDYGSPGYEAYCDSYSVEVKRQTAEWEKAVHEKAHQLLLRSGLPRGAVLPTAAHQRRADT